MRMFEVHGPWEVPFSQDKMGKDVQREHGDAFFRQHKEFAGAVGCYVFCMQAGRGFTPWYVGKSERGFASECFSADKLLKYQRCLRRFSKGRPVMFLLTLPRPRRGRKPTRVPEVRELEKWLIREAKDANSELFNIRLTKPPAWGVKGVFRAGKGKPSYAANALERALNRA